MGKNQGGIVTENEEEVRMRGIFGQDKNPSQINKIRPFKSKMVKIRVLLHNNNLYSIKERIARETSSHSISELYCVFIGE